MNEIVTAIRELLEPDPSPDPRTVAVDDAEARPLKWAEKTLYTYLVDVSEAGIESGPTARQDFTVEAVITGPEAGEEADEKRYAEVSTFLDGRLDTYLAAIRAVGRTELWGTLRARSANGPATLQLRARALRITGYRIVG